MNLNDLFRDPLSWQSLGIYAVIAMVFYFYKQWKTKPVASAKVTQPAAQSPPVQQAVAPQPTRGPDWHREQLLYHLKEIRAHAKREQEEADKAAKDQAQIEKLIQAMSGPGSE